MERKIGRALVVGAGIGGIRAALDLAETGYRVTLIDRTAHLGGILSQLDAQFPDNRCGMCKMLPLVARDSASQFCLRKGLVHENIDIRLSTELIALAGEAGRFEATLRQAPTWIDPLRCVGCGLCESVCPVSVPDDFNQGLTTRKAIHLPVPHAIPTPYVIDLAACNRCGECERICPTEAIRLSLDRRRSFRILVVDDELIVRESLKDLLEDEGFTVEAAASGPEALELLTDGAFNLMLTDLKMPGMDGVEVLEKAKAVAPELAVLMMTAYATVDTAVEAMKIGARDYLIKPFDPETLIPKILDLYQELEAARDIRLEVGAVVLCAGTGTYQPGTGANVHGYGRLDGVVTSLEFERMISAGGPFRGRLLRPGDRRPIRRIAWLQCVGSRDLQSDSDYCSSACCMIAVKQAMLATDRGQDAPQATIFYMDMRTYGKGFQRYRDRAEAECGIRFVRGRVHSVSAEEKTGDLVIRCVDLDGVCREEPFDLVVLSVGQRPASGTAALCEATGVELNAWGFAKTDPMRPVRTAREGVYVGGSFSGLRDIGESVVLASAAAADAGRTIHSAGGSLADASVAAPAYRDICREPPGIMVVICTCGGVLSRRLDVAYLAAELEKDPVVVGVVTVERACTAEGWDATSAAVSGQQPNRIVIGACHPYLFVSKLKELGVRIGLSPFLMEVVDLGRGHWQAVEAQGQSDGLSRLRMAAARLKRIDPAAVSDIPVIRRALVVGGGLAGMTAALSIADRGYPVDLVESNAQLGGNLNWIRRTIDGGSPGQLLTETIARIEKHPQVTVHLDTRVAGAFGQVGHFATSLVDGAGATTQIEHGVTVLATGGGEAPVEGFGYGTLPAVVTQKELEGRLNDGEFSSDRLNCVAMIQCAGTRSEPRNYCSRVCCTVSLKHALALKDQNPETAVFIFYRDMMTTGFSETYFTRARRAGVIFIQYRAEDPPRVSPAGPGDESVAIETFDPILGRRVRVEADMLVLAAGVAPNLPRELADAYGVPRDRDGFFQEAESKWRPVDAIKEGVFACGLALAPAGIPETVAGAMAAAQRCLRILMRERLPGARITAEVRHSLCALCERCIEACPYGARQLDPDRTRVTVNPAMCQGCGACAAACPNGAAVLHGLSSAQMLESIEAAAI